MNFTNLIVLTEKQARAILLLLELIDSEAFDGLNVKEQQLLSDKKLQTIHKKIEIAFPQLRKERDEKEFKAMCRQLAMRDPRVVEKQVVLREWSDQRPPKTDKLQYWEESHKKRQNWVNILNQVIEEFIASPEKQQYFKDCHCLICGELVGKGYESKLNPKVHNGCQPYPAETN